MRKKSIFWFWTLIFVDCILMPIGLFLFAWTARTSIHWAVPLVGVGLFCIGHYFTMQSLFIYLPFSYPQYAASLFAGNSLWRSGIAIALEGGRPASGHRVLSELSHDHTITTLEGKNEKWVE